MLLIAFRRGAVWPRAIDRLRVLPIGALLFIGGNGFVAIAELSVSSAARPSVRDDAAVDRRVLGAASSASA
jgi:hypothetical protein